MVSGESAAKFSFVPQKVLLSGLTLDSDGVRRALLVRPSLGQAPADRSEGGGLSRPASAVSAAAVAAAGAAGVAAAAAASAAAAAAAAAAGASGVGVAGGRREAVMEGGGGDEVPLADGDPPRPRWSVLKLITWPFASRYSRANLNDADVGSCVSGPNHPPADRPERASRLPTGRGGRRGQRADEVVAEMVDEAGGGSPAASRRGGGESEGGGGDEGWGRVGGDWPPQDAECWLPKVLFWGGVFLPLLLLLNVALHLRSSETLVRRWAKYSLAALVVWLALSLLVGLLASKVS